MTTAKNKTAEEWNVARYLAYRLQQLGIKHLFGVPGNHLGPFLSVMNEHTKVKWVGTPTELGAGYAADAYARVRGIGAAAVTYGVGAFSLLNPIGGAYAEQVPVIAINACPTYEQWLNYQAIGLLTSHMSQRRESNLAVYRQVTVDAQLISNPALAPQQIDAAITACLSERRPVYLEVMEDVWLARCAEPKGKLSCLERPFTPRNKETLEAAVKAAVELVGKLGKPILWAGEEIARFDLAKPFTELVAATRMPYCTTVGGKAAVSEDTPHFVGVYNGQASDPRVYKVFKKQAKCRIGLGSWSTSKNLAGEQSIGEDWIVAAREGVSVGSRYFPEVQLARFIPALKDALRARFGQHAFEADYFAEANAAGLDVPESTHAYRAALSTADYPEQLTYDGFFQHINAFLSGRTPEFTLVSDAAFALLGSMNLHTPDKGGFVAQNSWLSIGYSVGAATGVQLAGGKRPMVFVGDGAFQQTCQELATHTRYGLRPVVFVLDNEGFYGIEQMLVSPCFYKTKKANQADFYNFLHPWQYEKLADVFGSQKTTMTGETVSSHRGLAKVLDRIATADDPINSGPILVHVALSREDFPMALSYKLEKLQCE